MQFRQIGACMQRKYAFIGIQRAIGCANDVIEEGRPMSVNGTSRHFAVLRNLVAIGA